LLQNLPLDSRLISPKFLLIKLSKLKPRLKRFRRRFRRRSKKKILLLMPNRRPLLLMQRELLRESMKTPRLRKVEKPLISLPLRHQRLKPQLTRTMSRRL